MVSVDKKGFKLLGKVPSEEDAGDEYQWREFRFEFEEEVKDVEAFCHQLVEMEQEVVSKFTDHTGLWFQLFSYEPWAGPVYILVKT